MYILIYMTSLQIMCTNNHLSYYINLILQYIGYRPTLFDSCFSILSSPLHCVTCCGLSACQINGYIYYIYYMYIYIYIYIYIYSQYFKLVFFSTYSFTWNFCLMLRLFSFLKFFICKTLFLWARNYDIAYDTTTSFSLMVTSESLNAIKNNMHGRI